MKNILDSYDKGLVSALVGAGFSKNVSNLFWGWGELLQDMIGVLYEIDIKRNYDNYLHQSRGLIDIKDEADAALKYVKSRFARTLLGILKVTQDNSKETWRFVSLQDFSAQSNIDWSKSVAEIDQQLYKKYDLSPDEIDFIEKMIKSMA